jgi:ketosteroid isomerase-like protein
MSDIQTQLRDLYAKFNARDADGVLAMCAPDVDWPNAWEGGRETGHDAVRAYWTRQWQAIDPHVEPERIDVQPDGRVVVSVHQVVRDLDGAIVADTHVIHTYVLDDRTVTRMDVTES